MSDNGVGIPAGVLENGKPGHWGLAGMRERAAALGVDFSIGNGPDSGTVLELTLAAKLAFER